MKDLLAGSMELLGLCWRQDRRKTIASVVLVLGNALALPVGALALRWLLNEVLGGNTTQAVLAGVSVAMLAVGALTLGHFAHIAYFELSELNALRRDEQLAELVNGSARLDVHDDPEHADRLTVLDQEVQQSRTSLESLLNSAGLTLAMVVTAVLLGAVNPLLLLLPLVAVPPLWAGRRAETMVDEAKTAAATPTRLALHLFRLATGAGPAKELRTFRLQSELLDRHRRHWQDATDVLWRAQKRAALLRTAGQVAFATGYIVAVLLVVRDAIAGRHSVGDVLLVIVLAAQINAQVGQGVALLQELHRMAAVHRRIRELRGAIEANASGGTADAPERIATGIQLRGVGFSYPQAGKAALRDVALTLPAGSTIAIVGENGAGKSTLVNLLCGMYEPSEGDILIDGVPLRTIDPVRWRSRIAAGFQDFVRYEVTAGESVGVGDVGRVDESPAISTALTRAHAADLVGQLPDGLSTQLGKSYADGVELSGGQWQKLALGRAFMRDAPLLMVLDEPTSALDAETEHGLFERYSRRAKHIGAELGAITVLVSHRFSTVRMADLIIVMEDGRVVEAGDHPALLRADGTYAQLYRLQERAYG